MKNSSNREKRLGYVTRELRPYRLSFIDALSKHFNVTVGVESNNLQKEASNFEIFQYRNYTLRDKEGFGSRRPNLYLAPQLYLELLRRSFDIVIFEGTSASFGIAAILSKIIGSRNVVSYERTLHTERNTGQLRRVYHKMFFNQLSDGILANGDNTIEYLDSIGCGHTIYGRNVFPTTTPKTSLDQDRDIDIIFVGQLIPRKGIDELVRLLEVSYQYSFNIVLIGDGPLLHRIESYVTANPSIKHYASLRNESVIELMRRSKFLFLPTLEDNWSLVTLEAALVGCIPITTKYNGLWGDVLDDCNSVEYTFENFDWKEIASLKNQREVWMSLSTRCQELNSEDPYRDLGAFLGMLF